jgi:hypothetical protein
MEVGEFGTVFYFQFHFQTTFHLEVLFLNENCVYSKYFTQGFEIKRS